MRSSSTLRHLYRLVAPRIRPNARVYLLFFVFVRSLTDLRSMDWLIRCANELSDTNVFNL